MKIKDMSTDRIKTALRFRFNASVKARKYINNENVYDVNTRLWYGALRKTNRPTRKYNCTAKSMTLLSLDSFHLILILASAKSGNLLHNNCQ